MAPCGKPTPASSEDDAQRLGHAIDAQRRKLFQSLAIVQAIARLLTEVSDLDADVPAYADALTAAGDLLSDVIDQLEPMRLGLGIPKP